ncbi:MAG: hypothetical protein SGILL_004490 [Bacillariaceae sp.]
MSIGSRSSSLFLQPPKKSSSEITRTSSRSLSQHRAPLSSSTASTELGVGAELDPEEVLPLAKNSMITPEGFGFSSPASRVLEAAGRNGGYYKASADDIVTDVMDGITSGQFDAALVFDDDKLLGIFTETDYIKVSES